MAKDIMNSNNTKALKSGVWYTAANVVMKGIGFITTPLFTRLLSQSDYGLYSNYSSWLSTFGVFSTLYLGTTFIRARYEFEKDFDGYISSVLTLSTLITLLWALIINLFPTLFSSLTQIEHRYLNIMVVYYLFYSAVDMFQARERYFYKYKASVFTSLLIAFSTAFLSVLLVVKLDNPLFGRIIGSAFPTVCVGIILYAYIIFHGKKVNFHYWIYALPICLPYIPHILSLTLLNSMDKMMITKICGATENALYSVAYSCGAIVTLLVTSLNTAFSPWLGEKLNSQEYTEINKVSKKYILLFTYLTSGIMLFTPEVLRIMGGEGYSNAMYVMPPVAFGCVCQFLYTLYVNVEQFNKKTIGMAIASIFAALSNYVLNSVFIPKYGYIAAAYTTLASFAILLFIHMILVRRMGLFSVYPIKTITLVLIFMCGYTILINYIYTNFVIRIVMIIVYFILSFILLFRNKTFVLNILKHRDQ